MANNVVVRNEVTAVNVVSPAITCPNKLINTANPLPPFKIACKPRNAFMLNITTPINAVTFIIV